MLRNFILCMFLFYMPCVHSARVLFSQPLADIGIDITSKALGDKVIFNIKYSKSEKCGPLTDMLIANEHPGKLTYTFENIPIPSSFELSFELDKEDYEHLNLGLLYGFREGHDTSIYNEPWCRNLLDRYFIIDVSERRPVEY